MSNARSARLQRLIQRQDKVLAVLHPPTAAHARLMERAGCEACGLDYGFADAGDGPAGFVILLAGLIVVAAALAVEVLYQPPFWVHAALWGPMILIVTLAPLRLIKGLLIALQYHHKAAEGRFDRTGSP